jgi:hypothetical protein
VIASSAMTICESAAFDPQLLGSARTCSQPRGDSAISPGNPDNIEAGDSRDADHEAAVLAALHARLAELDKEIARLSDLALNHQDIPRQEHYLRIAQDCSARLVPFATKSGSIRSFVVQPFRRLLRTIYERLRNRRISSS